MNPLIHHKVLSRRPDALLDQSKGQSPGVFWNIGQESILVSHTQYLSDPRVHLQALDLLREVISGLLRLSFSKIGLFEC